MVSKKQRKKERGINDMRKGRLGTSRNEETGKCWSRNQKDFIKNQLLKAQYRLFT